MNKSPLLLPTSIVLSLTIHGAAQAKDAQAQVLANYKPTPDLKAFSAQRGKELFQSTFSSGKPDTPSCTTCHTVDPKTQGVTRAGKAIASMAFSKNPDRYQDAEKVKKWFRRNCKSVLGRVCTDQEKGDFLTFMLGQ